MVGLWLRIVGKGWVKMKLKDKTILITGASSGIGRLTAIALAEQGANVILVARSKDQLLSLEEEIRSRGGRAVAYPADVSRQEEVDQLVQLVLNQWQKIDVLINNAGYGVFSTVAESSMADIEGMMQVNYLGTIRCIKGFLPGMLARGEGHIINVASIAGKLGSPLFSGYNATKFAVVGFSESLYMELLGTGVHVTTICPGPVDTPFFKSGELERVLGPRGKKFALPPEKVVRAILKAVVKKPREIIVPGYMKPVILFKNMFPGRFARLSVRLFPKQNHPMD
jgi:short-subunit dehydrogenase